MPITPQRPYPYQSRQHPLLHLGEVTFTGSVTVDLGIGHNNYHVVPVLQGGLAAQNIAPGISVTKLTGVNAGKFTITAGKSTGAGDTTIIAATSACTVSFLAIAGATSDGP